MNKDFETFGHISGLMEAWTGLYTRRTLAEIRPADLDPTEISRIRQLTNILTAAFILHIMDFGFETDKNLLRFVITL